MIETFDRALAGAPCWVRDADGTRSVLPNHRWAGASGPEDRRADDALTSRCDGPTIDLGCGPGRLVADLLSRNVQALGVDISPVAVELARARGAPVLHRDLFDPLPASGLWSYALLADGNIGIGADPNRLLARTRELLAEDGVAVVEFDRPGTGIVHQRLRVETETGFGPWFPWTRVGLEHAWHLAAANGFRVRADLSVAGRHIVWMDRVGAATA
ncbi:methyltransferase domain-containing protein [Nocardia takedensis]|uniref:methyltransferase domain-containing protein n=1 Tax=Nocardia takedensis TaxID=259390 RepID=UPI0002DA5919|nr:class I SAM-dependent methyltransferase [Nocardia takedensis]